jgi:hypothetical protein
MVSGRIFPLILPADEPRPAITWQIIAKVAENVLEGIDGLDTVTLQIDCMGRTYHEAMDLAIAVREALTDYAGTKAGEVVQLIAFEYERDDHNVSGDNQEQSWFTKILEFTIYHT